MAGFALLKREIKMENRLRFKDWIYHAEWGVFMAIVVGCFLFVHAEAVKVNDRLDNHMQRMDNNMHQINQRCDDLHREFYELLKQLKDKN